MPEFRTIKVSESRYVCILNVNESFEDLLEKLNPNKDDLALVNSFKHQKKQLEWVAGRLAIKKLCDKFELNYTGIKKDEHGKPYLTNYPHEISLTHSYPYVAAIIDKIQPVGIDLEQPREKILRIAHKFLSKHELEFCDNNIIKLNMAWCAKEALYKIYGQRGLIFNEHLVLEPYAIGDDVVITGNIIVNDMKESYKLRCEVREQYILAYNL